MLVNLMQIVTVLASKRPATLGWGWGLLSFPYSLDLPSLSCLRGGQESILEAVSLRILLGQIISKDDKADQMIANIFSELSARD